MQIIKKLSPNYREGRNGYKVKAIVNHMTAGLMPSTLDWLRNSSAKVSAHYLVTKKGEIYQLVDENNTAWHCGIVNRPTWNGYDGNNPNQYCVTPDTNILLGDMTWEKAGNLKLHDEIIGFDEFPVLKNGYVINKRFLRQAFITALKPKKAEVYKITLEDGTILKSTGEHKWLYDVGTGHGVKWIATEDMNKFINSYKTKRGLILQKYFNVEDKKLTFEAGFLSASFDGEGHFSFVRGECLQLCFSQNENKMLKLVLKYLDKYNYKYTIIPNGEKCKTVQLLGGRQELFRFLHEFNPPRLVEKFRTKILENLTLNPINSLKVISVENIGVMDIIAFSSSTKTYIAEGFGSHNTVGIEHEMLVGDSLTDSQYIATLELQRDIIKRHNLKPTSDTIIGHNRIDSTKICPSDKFPMAKLIRDLQVIPDNPSWEWAEKKGLIDNRGNSDIVKMQDLISILHKIENPTFKPIINEFDDRIEYGSLVVELDPLMLRCKNVQTTGNQLLKKYDNFINGNLFNFTTPTTTIGWMIDDGLILRERHEYLSWKGNPKGTFIVYNDGSVFVGWKWDSDIVKELDKIKFCVQGFNLYPSLNGKTYEVEEGMEIEGFNPETVGRKTNRPLLGYNEKSKKAFIVVQKNYSLKDNINIMNRLGCQGKAIGLDGGSSTTASVRGNPFLFNMSRTLDNIIYWG